MTGNERLQQLIGHFNAEIGNLRTASTRGNIESLTPEKAEQIFEVVCLKILNPLDWPPRV